MRSDIRWELHHGREREREGEREREREREGGSFERLCQVFLAHMTQVIAVVLCPGPGLEEPRSYKDV